MLTIRCITAELEVDGSVAISQDHLYNFNDTSKQATSHLNTFFGSKQEE